MLTGYQIQSNRQEDWRSRRHQACKYHGFVPATSLTISQIDLESSEDDILEIQQEISVLSTCASPFVTQYIASFLRGHKLWIVMEYLGGGSCLDLVGNHSRLSRTVLT
jgi:serine/threonine protein kinase